MLRRGFTAAYIKGTCTGEVSEVSRDGDPLILWLLASIFAELQVVSETFGVSSLHYSDRLSDSLVVSPVQRSLDIAPPVTNVFDHPERVAVNSQGVDAFKIRYKANQLTPINAIQSI